MEKLLTLLANVKIESDSAVQIAKYYILMNFVQNIAILATVILMGVILWIITDRIYVKK